MPDAPTPDALDPPDAHWGRRPGARPPLPAWVPLGFAAALAVLLTLVVALVVRPPGPLDQPDPADQRNGLLLDGPRVPGEVGEVSFGGGPVVLLFLRQAPDPGTLQSWSAAVPEAARAYVVIQNGAGRQPEVGDREAGGAGYDVVVDPEEQLADAVDLPEPRDGGPGIGYAVVDSERVVRYSTLDPAWPDNAFEIATIVGELR